MEFASETFRRRNRKRKSRKKRANSGEYAKQRLEAHASHPDLDSSLPRIKRAPLATELILNLPGMVRRQLVSCSPQLPPKRADPGCATQYPTQYEYSLNASVLTHLCSPRF